MKGALLPKRSTTAIPRRCITSNSSDGLRVSVEVEAVGSNGDCLSGYHDDGNIRATLGAGYTQVLPSERHAIVVPIRYPVTCVHGFPRTCEKYEFNRPEVLSRYACGTIFVIV